MKKDRIIYLHAQYLNQKLSPDEFLEWQSVVRNPTYEKFLQALMQEAWTDLKVHGTANMPDQRASDIFLDIINQSQATVRKKHWYFHPAVAASVALMVAISGYWYFWPSKNTASEMAVVKQEVISPGKSGATLTLSNGKKFKLSDVLAGKMAEETGVTITKTANGELIYEISGKQDKANSLNQLSTACGETYRLRLPDGSGVWLNASSSIKYPANFAHQKERRVFLTGEAYFEVSKDKKHPFVVVSNNQEVRVLGTHFNVNAYNDRQKIKTTLLEGSVQVVELQSGLAQTIKPNQMAVLAANSIDVEDVDAEEAVAWKNDYFLFSGKTLEEAMQEVARWYNIEVAYKNTALRKKLLAGTISKYANITTVLKTMELTGALHFTIQGKKIIVE